MVLAARNKNLDGTVTVPLWKMVLAVGKGFAGFQRWIFETLIFERGYFIVEVFVLHINVCILMQRGRKQCSGHFLSEKKTP